MIQLGREHKLRTHHGGTAPPSLRCSGEPRTRRSTMPQAITGTLRFRFRRLWIVTAYDMTQCEAETSDGRQFGLRYHGNWHNRVYRIVDNSGASLAVSQQLSADAKGLLSFMKRGRHVAFFDGASGGPIVEMEHIRGRATKLRFGTADVAFHHCMPKWFGRVFESEYFRFESTPFRHELGFQIKRPDFLLPSLCAGYLDYVTRVEDGTCS